MSRGERSQEDSGKTLEDADGGWALEPVRLVVFMRCCREGMISVLGPVCVEGLGEMVGSNAVEGTVGVV